MKGWSCDIETDNLYLQSKVIWYIKLEDNDDSTKFLKLYPFREPIEVVRQKFKEWVDSYPDKSLVVLHNGLGFDVWVIWKILGITPRVGKESKDWLDDKPVQFVDTYVLSMYLSPDNPSHSLAYLSSGSENEKMDFRQKLIEAGALAKSAPKGAEFRQWHPLMEDYCDDDVSALKGVFKRLWHKAKELYGDAWIHPSFRQMQKDYWLYSAQAYTGVKFNKEKAERLVELIEKKMMEIKAEVDPKLPPRSLKTAEQAYYKIPAKPFTKSGEYSATFVKWLEKHNATVIDGMIHCEIGGKKVVQKLVANDILDVKLPMEIEDNAELKQYFIDNGWVASEDFWNFKRGADGKPMRDDRGKIIKTTPKIQHAGQICPNLLRLEGDIPSKVVKFLSYRNRLGIVKGWLENWRLEFDGRLSAEISGYTPTSRVRHKTVCNVPKADPKVLLGNEMRDLFTVDSGFWYNGTDAAALENRTLASYTYKYDGGKFARMQIEGDPHCYSEDTEVLTPSGWKTFGNLSIGEKVAQYDSGRISFVEPSHIVWQDYSGEMVSIKSGKLDFLVTPNHRMLVEDFRTRNPKVILAENIHNKNSNWRIPLNGYAQSTGINVSDAAIKLVVAIQADANDAGTSYRFEFVKERKITRLTEILNSLNIAFNITSGTASVSGNKTFRVVISKELIPDVAKLIVGKEWTDEVYNLSAKQALVFVNEVKFWDGTILENGDYVLDTTSERSRDVVATLACLCGRKATTSKYLAKKGNFGDCDIYRVYVSGKEEIRGAGLLGSRINRVKYSGKIGCVSVPSTFILVRRNGRIAVSGNTFNAFAFFPHLHGSFDINNPELKEVTEFKPWRNKAKTGAYLLAFGGGAQKLASSLGLSKSEGQAAYDNYWTMNEGLGKLKTAVEKYFSTKGENKYLYAIDGRFVSVRAKNVLLSCLGQGCGAIAMSYAACFMDTWLGDLHLDELGRPYYLYKGKIVKRISMVHDEYSWEVQDGIEEEVREMSVKAIVKAGETLKLSLPLAGEGKKSFEGSWLHVH